MQFFVFCFFVVAVIFLVQGIRKSSFGVADGAKQHCATCGWTKEKVQLCQFEQGYKIVTAPLCFDCSLACDALPVRDVSVNNVRTAFV